MLSWAGYFLYAPHASGGGGGGSGVGPLSPEPLYDSIELHRILYMIPNFEATKMKKNENGQLGFFSQIDLPSSVLRVVRELHNFASR